MSFAKWLTLASVLAPTSIAAQVDTAFKNVEYLVGSSAMTKKQKGTLVISRTAIRLVDKKGAPYLTIPVADIQRVDDAQSIDASATGKAKASLLRKAGALGSLFGGGSKQKLIISTKNSSGDEAVIEFKVHEGEATRQIIARIRFEVNNHQALHRSSERRASADSLSGSGRSGDASTEVPRLLVTNPFTAATQDSAAAVEIGNAVRAKITTLMGSNVHVVTRDQMNAALDKYGYPADAMLDSSLAVTLAETVQASVIIVGKLTKGNDGKYMVAASLTVIKGQASTPVTVVQGADESLVDFGHRVAEKLKGE